jgi:tetratricopeptide (TPR) repeat protein
MTGVITSSNVRSGGTVERDIKKARELLKTDPREALNFTDLQLRSFPDRRLFRIAAAACRQLGLARDAEDAELAAIQAAFRVPVLDRAAVAAEQGRQAEARTILEQFLGQEPDDLLALTMAAEADIKVGQLEQAEARLNTILGRAPSFLRAIMLLAQCLTLQARLKEAMAVAEGVVRRKPNNKPALHHLAQLSAEANDHDKAVELYGRILAIEPARTDLWILQGQHLRMLGRKAESQAAFRRALALEPENGSAWWGLANYFASDMTEADVQAMEQALANGAGRPQNNAPLHIALSIFAERAGNHGEAFNHVATGKAIQAQAYPYDSEVITLAVDKLSGIFTAEHFAHRRSAGATNDSPIFIIGMSRSGTTLLERILSRHSRIEACGELPILPRVHERLRSGREKYPEDIPDMSDEEFAALGQSYLKPSNDYRMSDKPRFIDKLNTNWFHVGLLRTMLPNAKIIDLRRNALDCCWSNFKMLFAEGHIASNDQRDIARYYRDYVRMVEAISAALPGGILHVRYEDLVDDVEGQTRGILEFLGLEYEADCIDFHLSTSAVATPSSEQVRRPINREGIGSAAPYREWLGPMVEELGELADA